MSDELFDVSSVQQDSPRLAWCKKHNVQKLYSPGECWKPWSAWVGDLGDCLSMYGDHGVGVGDTEDEALADLANKRGIKLWNEEAQP